jgi:hypothetical protein
MREPGFLKGTKYELEEPELPQETGPQPDTSRNGTGDAEDGPPAPGPAGVSRRESRGLAMRGAAESAILRCRGIAGSRLRTLHRQSAEFAAISEGQCRNADLAATAGQAVLLALGTPDPMELVKGGAQDFVDVCLEWDIDNAQAVAMGQQIEVYASKTLFEKGLPKFSPGLAAAIERANEVSTEMTVRKNNEALKQLASKVPGLSTLAGGD